MAKVTTKTKKAPVKQKKEMFFPFGKENFIIIGIGIVDIIIGYIFLAQGPVDGFSPMVIAPILLVLGYCVIIPYGILKKPKKEIEVTDDFAVSASPNVTASQPVSTVSSNIKTS
jgi:hypothetical protein